MAAEIVNSRLVPALGLEVITIMDDFGTEFTVQIKTSDSANRQAYIDAAIAQQTNNQTNVETYAAAHGIDLSAQRAAGLAKKQAAKMRTRNGAGLVVVG